ncbi:MAG: S24 family peptidase [Anaerolineales bacterium]|nr:S24 family peptidase [Anaerolineales bacterium]
MKTARYHPAIARLLSDRLEPGDTFRLQITSYSMHPLLQPGDTLLAQVVPLQDLRRGDLLVVRRATDFVTHRLILQDGDTWIIKGDRSTQADPAIQPDQVLGRVIAIERHGRTKRLQRPIQSAGQRLLGWIGWLEILAVQYGRAGPLPLRGFSRLIRHLLQ